MSVVCVFISFSASFIRMRERSGDVVSRACLVAMEGSGLLSCHFPEGAEANAKVWAKGRGREAEAAADLCSGSGGGDDVEGWFVLGEALVGSFDVIQEGIAGLFPAVEAPAEGADAGDAEFVELKSEFATGLFRWAGAVEDDVAVSGNAGGAGGYVGGEDAEGTGQDAGVGEVVEGVAEVDDEGCRGAGDACGVVEGHKLGGFEAKGADAGEETALFDVAVCDEAKDGEGEESDGEVAEHGEHHGAALDEVSEEPAAEEEGQGPDG